MTTKLQNSEVRNALKLHTDLSEPQQRLMRSVVRLLPFATSLPQQDVCVFTGQGMMKFSFSVILKIGRQRSLSRIFVC